MRLSLVRARTSEANVAPLVEPPSAARPEPRQCCHGWRYFAELIEGRGYSATLAVDAPTIEDARAAAARYASANGYRLGRVKRARGRKAGW